MVATLQRPPALAAEYSRAQRAQIDAALAEISARWKLAGPAFDASWSAVGPSVVAIVVQAQREMIARADKYVPAVLEDTGQSAAVATLVTPRTESLTGYSGEGYAVADTLSYAPVRAKQAVADGATPAAALGSSGDWLAMTALTTLADTARAAEAIGMYSRPVAGYVRMVNGGACGRCVVQAGKWFRKNKGFLRHPRCRCVHIPASENRGADWSTNPDEYFRSLNDQQRIKLMGSKANAQAVVDGADITQVVNAYGRTAGMRFAQVSPIKRDNLGQKFSTVTKRSSSFRAAQAARQNSKFSGQRLMPESIYRVAKDQDDAIRLLRINGWIL